MKKPMNEAARLASLNASGILGARLDRDYEELTELAAAICAAPAAAVSLVGEDRVWFRAKRGPLGDESSREAAFCSRTILSEKPNCIEDLKLDPDFASQAAGENASPFRAYLGVPLLTADGLAIGALCVLDFEPRAFTAQQIRSLEILARQVMSRLELRSTSRALDQSEKKIGHERELFRELVEELQEVVFRADANGRWTYLNPAWEQHLGFDPWGSVGQPMESYVHARDLARFQDFIGRLKEKDTGTDRGRFWLLTRQGSEKLFSVAVRKGRGSQGEAVFSGTLTDLTSEATATERERVIQSFYASSPFYMGIAEIHAGRLLFISVNPAAQRLLRAEHVTFPADSYAVGMNSETTAWWLSKYEECTAAGGVLAFDATFHEGAERRWLRVHLSRVQNDDGSPARYSFLTADITEEKQKSDLVERQRLLLETMSNHVGDVIWMADLSKGGEISFVSKAYERIWGQSRESLLADRQTFLKPIHPDDRPRVLAALPRQALGTYEEVYRVVSPSGVRWVRDRAFPVRDEKGHVVQLVGLASDITEVRQQEEAVRRAKQNLEMVIGHLPVAVCVFSSDGTREFVNGEWTKLLGFTQDEIFGTRVPPTMYPDEETFAAAQAFHDQPGATREFRVCTKDGDIKHTLVSNVALPLGKFMTISRDLTHERSQEQMIEKQRTVMIESARLSSLGEMAAGVAHEINNPLAIIQGSAELVISAMERGTVLEEEKLRRTMERISTTVNRIAKIIVGLKSFARDGRKDPLLPSSLKTIISDALELCQTRFRNNGVELEVELPETDVAVAARTVQLSQLLVNLLNNSFDAVAEQSSKRVRVVLKAEGDQAYLSVQDNGPGVPDDLKEKIMQPFFTTKAPGKGTGLGLSLSRSIVEDHGGKLRVRTEKGLTCFEAEFPIVQAGKLS